MAKNDPFYKFMVDLKLNYVPANLSPIFDAFLAKLVATNKLLYLGPQYSHDIITKLLDLTINDVSLLRDHHIDLRYEWNKRL